MFIALKGENFDGNKFVIEAFENGAKVALCGSREETVNKALEKLKEINSDFEVLGFSTDLLNIEDIKKMMDEVENKWEKIDVLINNAGISDNVSIYEQDDKHFENVIDINVQAVFNCSKIAAEKMKKNNYGVILNTSSIVSINGQKSGVGYPTSKFAVNGLTKSLARELGKDGIRVNAIAPGFFVTAQNEKLLFNEDGTPTERTAKILNSTPMDRFGKAEELLGTLLYLVSEEASGFVNGVVIPVDGAFSAYSGV